jgi:hypothetical protein
MMTARPLLTAALLTLTAATGSAASALGPHPLERAPEPADRVSYELRVLSHATSLACDASHAFRSTLTVCGPESCRSRDITEQPHIAFDALRGGRIQVATSTTYSRNGVVYGETEVDRMATLGEQRFVQTVVGHSGCIKSLVYAVGPAAE